ncbi:MAG: ATP-binding protein [Muribaculaceae bacterium]|nr:ATP-binding protein [Muribaculaceae bacterium]
MKLISFSCTTAKWSLKDFRPQDLTLLVAKNAVGKSRTIDALGYCVEMISQTEKRHRLFKYEGALSCAMTFEHNGEDFCYEFAYTAEHKVEKETLTINVNTPSAKELLRRTATSAQLHSANIAPPAEKLVLHVRRDTKQYPYFELIVRWAENACTMTFNQLEVRDNMLKVSLPDMLAQLSDDNISEIMLQAQQLGYPIEKIGVKVVAENNFAVFKEKDVSSELAFINMSSGMYRSIYILILMRYLALRQMPSILLIDDLCEGLDYHRSVLLGKMVCEYSKANNIQLICASNDNLLMQVIPLENWTILLRHGENVDCMDKWRYPELYRKFALTGLSNFDFFSSNFIERQLSMSQHE